MDLEGFNNSVLFFGISNSCAKCDDLSKLISDMKQKMKVCNQWEKLQLLTLVSEPWSKKKAAQEFHVYRNLVTKAKHFK